MLMIFTKSSAGKEMTFGFSFEIMSYDRMMFIAVKEIEFESLMLKNSRFHLF